MAAVARAVTPRYCRRQPLPDRRAIESTPGRTVCLVFMSIVVGSVTPPPSSMPALVLEPSGRRDERELIARVVDGDRMAARGLYDAHAPRVFRLAFRLTGDDEAARELTQEAFIRAFGQLARFRGDAAFSTWLHRVTLSVAS